MNLEGTKHEKAVLVIITYIIGFTSSFIAFGITGYLKEEPESVNFVTSEIIETPTVIDNYAAPTEPPPLSASEPVSTEVAYYEDGKLYATVSGERFLLSLSSDIVKNENVEGFSTQGIHEALPMYNASADGNYVYFCEQQTKEPECASFVFDAAKSVIQPVSSEGTRLVLTNDVAKTARWDNGTLIIGNYRSTLAEAPWKLLAE